MTTIEKINEHLFRSTLTGAQKAKVQLVLELAAQGGLEKEAVEVAIILRDISCQHTVKATLSGN